MKSINGMRRPDDSKLGHWGAWINDVMGQLDTLRITPKTPITVNYVATEWTSTNGKKWHCEHISASMYDVIVQPDSSEAVLICDDCDAQLINNEWAEGSV